MAEALGVGAALAAINEFVAAETAELPKPARYGTVNGAWPDGTNEGRNVKPTPQEALSGFRRLYRVAFGRPYRGRLVLTSGNRATWYGSQSRTIRVNPDEDGGGWHEIVHSVSHMASRALYKENHGPRHAWIERQLIHHAVSSGWLDGKLKRPEKPPAVTDRATLIRRKLESIAAKSKRWQTKAKRAKTALAKLERQRKHYERHLPA